MGNYCLGVVLAMCTLTSQLALINTYFSPVFCSNTLLSAINVIVVCMSVRPSVTEGQRKQLDFKTQDTVSLAIDQKKLRLGSLYECQSRL